MNVYKRSAIVEVISILFMILFLYTGVNKLINYTVFKEQIATSPLLAPIAPYIAGGLPWVEFLLVIILFVPSWRLKGLYASLGIMVLFTGYIVAILMFNEHIPCSCGGILEELSWKQHIVFNSTFIALALTGIAMLSRLKKEKRMELA